MTDTSIKTKLEQASEISLSDLERKVLSAWAGTEVGYGYHFRDAARRSGIQIRDIRGAARALARKGILEFNRSAWTEDGEMYGACYAITEAGRAALTALNTKEATNDLS